MRVYVAIEGGIHMIPPSMLLSSNILNGIVVLRGDPVRGGNYA